MYGKKFDDRRHRVIGRILFVQRDGSNGTSVACARSGAAWVSAPASSAAVAARTAKPFFMCISGSAAGNSTCQTRGAGRKKESPWPDMARGSTSSRSGNAPLS